MDAPAQYPTTLAATVARFRPPRRIRSWPDEIPAGETADDSAARRARQAQARRAAFDRTTPQQFASASLDQLDPDVRSTVGQWLAGTSRTLVLKGSVGTGKSHVAYAIGRHAVDEGFTAVGWTVPDLMVAIAPDGDGGAERRAFTADFLLLDDLGTEKVSEWRVERMGALVDARVRNNLRQVVTTNTSYVDLVCIYGERIMSRLTGGAVVIELRGEDRRRTSW